MLPDRPMYQVWPAKKCAVELRHRILDYAAYMLNHDVTDLSKTIYADQVKEAAQKLRKVLGLLPEDEIKEDMLDIVDSKIVVHGGDPVLFDVAVVADTAFYSLDKSIHLTAEVTNQCLDNILLLRLLLRRCRSRYAIRTGNSKGYRQCSCPVS